MRVLITGGSGYNGSVVAVELAVAGHDVVCLDSCGKVPGWEFWQSRGENFGKVEFAQGDVCDTLTLKHLADNSDAIVHLAFVVGGPACKERPEEARNLAIYGTKAVLEARADKMVVFPSSDAVYGNKAQGLCQEDFPCEPASLYAELKFECEEMIREAGNFVIFRLPSNFGVSPKMRHNLLVHYLVAEMSKTGRIDLYEGEVTRTLIHVRDVALAIRFTLEHQEQVAGGIFNIASCSLQKIKMAQIIAEVFGGEIVPDKDDTHFDPEKRDFILDCSRIKDLGWQPEYTFTDGIKSLRSYLNSIQAKE